MWVRSQEKVILLNVNDICIYEIEIDEELYYEIRNYGYGDDYYILGRYSSKQKAIKVLDMLQGCITGNKFSNYEIMCDCPIAGVEYHGVFRMPQDDEVKENE